MEVLIVILPLALIISGCFVWSFIRAVRKGQFEDLSTPAYRILLDDIKKTNHNCEEKE